MKIVRFEIANYRAISGPLVIDIAKQSLFPIIGINESGKTTVLQAILAFDRFADEMNDGRHLSDIANLYRTSPAQASVTATIECSRFSLLRALKGMEEQAGTLKTKAVTWRKKRQLPSKLTITRNLDTKQYSVREAPFHGCPEEDAFCESIVASLPFILYFDDFRDKVDARIVIPTSPDETGGGWASIAEQLFNRTDPALSTHDLADMEERRRRSVLSRVQRALNQTLTREWQNFRLDDSNALEIAITYEADATRATGGALKLDVVERDAAGESHYFFVSDRSKGFYWFFNFVMKLEFNPKVNTSTAQGTIYLLDEPGSYLHATAQAKLCAKLRALSEGNTVLYCTHSHYLLNPEVIPLNAIRVADKDGNGNITLVPIDRHEGNIIERRSAFQPVVDALQIKPFVLDLSHSRAILVEGIYDYYSLEMFRHNRPVSVIPSVGADSIKFYISLLLAWQVSFHAVWDNDDAGRGKAKDARRIFGDELADRCFRMLPTSAPREKRIMQNLFAGEDLVLVRREIGLGPDASFEKTIAALFYSSRRGELLNHFSTQTVQNFATTWDHIANGL
jgi:hypothetical protein